MTARRLYTEEQVRDAWQQACLLARDPWNFHEKFLAALRAGKPKERAMLFTRDDLLAVAATEHEKLIVHGIFAILDTQLANEQYILAQARKANLGGSMEIMIRLAKAKKEEDFQPGDVVKDADKIFWQLTGNRMWATFTNPVLALYDEPRRPLEKM